MITRQLPGLHICLSCRRSLANRLHILSASRSHSRASIPPARKSPADYSIATNEELENNNYRNRTDRRKVGHIARDKSESFDKLYGHHGNARRASLEDLRTNRLNDPAHAIVLKDSVFNFYSYDTHALQRKDAEHIDIEGQLNNERGLVGQEEVNENINTFEPQPGKEPSNWDEINNLMRELQDGFTTPQLEKYIEMRGNHEAKAFEIEWENGLKGEAIQRMTSWLPGTSETEHTFDADPLRGYFLDSHTNKQRIILRLLRDCWNVELPELEEGLGQFEVEIKPDHLHLLVLGQHSALDGICNQILTLQNEKMEVFRARNIIRVTTTRNRRRRIINEIEENLSRVSVHDIDLTRIVQSPQGNPTADLDAIIKEVIDDSMLQELSILTRCSIIRKGWRFLEVSCIEKKPNPSHIQKTTIDDVKRLLVSSIKIPERVKTQLAYGYSDPSKAAFVKCAPSLTSSLPWFHRTRQWSRWIAPIDPLEMIQSLPKPEARKLKKAFDFEAPEDIVITPPKPLLIESNDEVAALWNPRYFTETSALIGTVLHKNMTPEQSFWGPQKGDVTESIDHTFGTNIPTISKIFNERNIRQLESGRPTKLLVLRFTPNPFSIPHASESSKKKSKTSSDPEIIGQFPPLEMRFSVDETKQRVRLMDIQAIVQETRTDIMIPDNMVDVRFQQFFISRLKRRLLDPVKKYIKSSNLTMEDGHAYPLPKITLPVSRHLATTSRNTSTTPIGELKDDNYEVEYLFTGLETRWTIEHDWMGWRLEYTSIKAGRAAGSRSELRLRPIKDGEKANEEDFIKASYLLADLVGGSGYVNDKSEYTPRFLKPIRVFPKLVRKVDSSRRKFFYFQDSKPHNFSTKSNKDFAAQNDTEGVEPVPDALDYEKVAEEEDEGESANMVFGHELFESRDEGRANFEDFVESKNTQINEQIDGSGYVQKTEHTNGEIIPDSDEDVKTLESCGTQSNVDSEVEGTTGRTENKES